MSRYEDGLKIMDERCAYGKDNIISLATIAMETSADSNPRPYIRDLDAHYEDGVFYITTWAKSTKMLQIAQTKSAFSVCSEWISGNGIGENLGWILDARNADLRTKLRKTFANWYDTANKEDDENCIILAIRITRATIIKDHGADRYDMDFVNKVETEEGKIK